MDKRFTVDITNSCKGIAICLMIIHHLFFNVTNMGVEIYHIVIAQKIGILSKVCVAIFLILSGYGLEKKYGKECKIYEFYKKRFLKLYINYWFVVTISIVIGLIFFSNECMQLLGDKPIIRALYNYTGIQFLTGYQGYNGAWWYITLTVILYILFPLIRIGIEKYNGIFLIFSSLTLFPNLFNYNILNIKWIVFWFFPFILGVFLAYNNTFEKLAIINEEKGFKYINALLILLMFIIIIPKRLRLGMSYEGYALDSIFGFLIIIFNYFYLSKIKEVNRLFIFLGRYSMDMFLIHGFITTIYTANFIYSIKDPIIMFIITLLLSLIIAIFMGKVKRVLKIN